MTMRIYVGRREEVETHIANVPLSSNFFAETESSSFPMSFSNDFSSQKILYRCELNLLKDNFQESLNLFNTRILTYLQDELFVHEW